MFTAATISIQLFHKIFNFIYDILTTNLCYNPTTWITLLSILNIYKSYATLLTY